MPKRKASANTASPESRPSDAAADTPPQDFKPLRITGHRGLAARQRAIVNRFNARPDLAVLLAINPVLAFKDIGIVPSRMIVHHILETLQYPPALRERREKLHKEVLEALHEQPKPNEPTWVARILFETLKIEPLDTKGVEPTYRQPFDDDTLQRLNALRPKPRSPDRYGPQHDRGGGTTTTVGLGRPTARRMDLDARLPGLKPASECPQAIDLETLYFYKDSHPVARQVLELGIIQRMGFPIHTGGTYQRIKTNRRPNALRAWIKNIRFPEGDDDESDQ